MLIFSK